MMDDVMTNALHTELEAALFRAQQARDLFKQVSITEHTFAATAQLQEWWADGTGLPWTNNSPVFTCVQSLGVDPYIRIYFHHYQYGTIGYYGFMRLARGFAEPFCDPLCPVQIDDNSWHRGGTPRLTIEKIVVIGDVHACLGASCTIPDRIMAYLKRKKILQLQAPDREALTVVCPTEAAEA